MTLNERQRRDILSKVLQTIDKQFMGAEPDTAGLRREQMTTYLLDTNVCIALINGSSTAIRRRFQREAAEDAVMLFSSVVAFELWYGVEKSREKEQNTLRVHAFAIGPLEWAPFDEDDAREAGVVRAALEAKGTPMTCT